MNNPKTNLWLIIMLLFMSNQFLMGQIYYPTSVKSAFFDNKEILLFEVGINNYSMDYSIHYQYKRFIMSLQYDYNNTKLDINPLNFHEIEIDGVEMHRIQTLGSQTKYSEFRVSYNLNVSQKKLEIGCGIGRNFLTIKNRFFAQIGIGNENNLIDAGITCRASYVENIAGFDILNPIASIPINAIVLEPSIQGKFKLGKFRIINQFGFAIITSKNEDYMKPNLRIGIGYKY